MRLGEFQGVFATISGPKRDFSVTFRNLGQPLMAVQASNLLSRVRERDDNTAAHHSEKSHCCKPSINAGEVVSCLICRLRPS